MKYLNLYEEYYNSNAAYEYQWKNQLLTAIYKDSRYNSDIKLVKDLVLNKNVNINFKEKDQQNFEFSPLTLAIRLMDDSHIYLWSSKIAIFLIDNGADVNLTVNNGRSPLMTATTFNETNIVKKLINKGAIIDAQDNEGNTALIIGLNSPRYGIDANLIIELIKAGADWFIQNKNGDYPYKLMKKNLGDYYIKNVIVKECPEEYNNAMMIINSEKYNL